MVAEALKCSEVLRKDFYDLAKHGFRAGQWSQGSGISPGGNDGRGKERISQTVIFNIDDVQSMNVVIILFHLYYHQKGFSPAVVKDSFFVSNFAFGIFCSKP